MKKKDLLSFLFLESAEDDSAEAEKRELNIAENLEQLFEAAAEAEQGELESKKTPLAKALSEFGISDADLQLDPEGFAIVTDNHDKYVDMITVLGTPEAMHKLAEMGWVVTKPGDVAMTNEPAEYHVRFLEITLVDTGDADKPDEKVKEINKQAREFASTPMDREDELNPVENEDGKMGKKDAGVGKEKDGAEPEKAIHDALARGDMDSVMEFTSTGSMGTAMSQGQPFVGMVKKPKPYGKGTKFKTPGQWKVKQPVVDQQVKRKAHSESTDPVEQQAEAFLKEEDGSEADFAGEIAPDSELNPEAQAQEEFREALSEMESGECAVFSDRGSGPTRVTFMGKLLGTVPGTFADQNEALAAVNAQMEAQQFWPNIYYVNDHGNISLWDKNGNEIRAWV